MDLSIIILNYKSKGLVKQCVKTIGLHPPSCSYEVIVVDNDSRDGVGAILAEKFSEVRFIQTGMNIGYACGNNVGIRASLGKYVMIMNPDITVMPGSIDALMAHMNVNPDIGMTGPRLIHPDGSNDESCFRFPTPAIPVYRRTPLGATTLGKAAVAHYVMDDFDRLATTEVDWLLGATVLVRRSAIDRVGMLDERYFLYFEDTDWCRRFWEAGERVVFFSGAVMVHYHERLSAHSAWYMAPFSKAMRVHVASAVKYFLKWKDAPRNPRLAAAEREQAAP